MTKRLTLAALALAALPLTASADDVPRYDVESYCQDVSDMAGGSNSIFNSCIDMEQDAYNELKSRWSGLSARTRSYCDEIGQTAGESYSIMNSCVDMETEAADNRGSFSYD